MTFIISPTYIIINPIKQEKTTLIPVLLFLSTDYGYEYMYLENDSLYRYRDNSFYFIYSLNAQVGASIYVYDPDLYGYHAVAKVDNLLLYFAAKYSLYQSIS